MEKHEDNVLKKLGRRRKMFEDYINLIKKPDGVKVRLRREKWDVGHEKANRDVRDETRDVEVGRRNP